MENPVLTAIIAATLFVLTVGVWRLARQVADCCARNDAALRGYLFPLQPILYRDGGGEAGILTKLGNFGRTPCILKESYLERHTTEPSGNPATYQNGRLLQHDLVFDVKAQDVTLSAPAYPVDGAAISYVVGYLRYLDVFGASHMTRFCYRIEPSAGKVERAGSAPWNAFD